jgi:hypothetical protein
VPFEYNNNKYKTYNVTAGLQFSALTESSSGPHDIDQTQNVLCTVGSPTLTVSVVNNNESE